MAGRECRAEVSPFEGMEKERLGYWFVFLVYYSILQTNVKVLLSTGGATCGGPHVLYLSLPTCGICDIGISFYVRKIIGV